MHPKRPWRWHSSCTRVTGFLSCCLWGAEFSVQGLLGGGCVCVCVCAAGAAGGVNVAERAYAHYTLPPLFFFLLPHPLSLPPVPFPPFFRCPSLLPVTLQNTHCPSLRVQELCSYVLEFTFPPPLPSFFSLSLEKHCPAHFYKQTPPLLPPRFQVRV